MPCSIITLTTDFGVGSPYVAQMKGVILSINTDVSLVDITHEIAPQDVRSAAQVLDEACRWFPEGTIHVAVVDPGVGTERPLVCASLGCQHFIAPDNGLLSLVLRGADPIRIIRLADRRYWRKEVSSTFHGRDILAPVAAYLSRGVSPDAFGPRHDQLVSLDFSCPVRTSHSITGKITSIDSFGNLISNIDSSMLPGDALRASVRVRLGSHEVQGLVSTYGNGTPGSLVALIGSAGRLEIAVVGGDAAQQLHARVGDEVLVFLPC